MRPLATRSAPAHVAELVARYARRSRADNTLRVYSSQWRTFERWCSVHGLGSLPAEPHTIAAYVAERAQAGISIATINQAIAAIAFAHTAAGAPFSRAQRELNLVLGGIRREHVRLQRQAKPLTADLLHQVLARSGSTVTDLRDGALLSILYTFALRPSEAVALDWMQPGNGHGWIVVQGAEAELVLLGSKAAPGQVERVVLPTSAIEGTVRSLQKWITSAGVMPGQPILRALSRGDKLRKERLNVGSVSLVMRQALTRYFITTGHPPAEARALARSYSGHSGRVGFCVSASAAGVAPQHIATFARHKGLSMVRRYTKQQDLLSSAPHRCKGVGV